MTHDFDEPEDEPHVCCIGLPPPRGAYVIVLHEDWLDRFVRAALGGRTLKRCGRPLMVFEGSEGPQPFVRHLYREWGPELSDLGVAGSDDTVRELLVEIGATRVQRLRDGGSPEGLARFAREVGLEREVPSKDIPYAGACLAFQSLRLAGAGRKSDAGIPVSRALAAAARILMEADNLTEGEVREQAIAAGLWPSPRLGIGGLPRGMAAGDCRVLPEGAAGVFAAATRRLADRCFPDFVAAPPPRPVLRALPPPGDPLEMETIDRHSPLAQAVPRVPVPDPHGLDTALRRRFPWLDGAIRRVVREVALLPASRGAVLPPLLIAGPPGCGKSTFARFLFENCGLSHRTVHGTDGNGTTSIGGSARGWRSGRPLLPLTVMAEEELATVGIVVDDVDRQATADTLGRPQDLLVSLLEPSSARRFLDPFLLVEADVTSVSWALTCNDLRAVAGALVDRCVLMEIDYPPPEAAEVILEGVFLDLASELEVEAVSLRLPRAVRALLLDAVRANPTTLRDLKRAARVALGAARLRQDAAAAARAELARAALRDDRAYANQGRVGFRP